MRKSGLAGLVAAGLTVAALACAPAAAQAPAPAPAPAPAAAATAPALPAGAMPVYGVALADGWSNWSWAKTTLSIDLSGSARHPIKAEAGPYQAVYLHHDGFSTAPYRRLGFLIHGGPTGGQQIAVMATIAGKPIPDKVKSIKLTANGWTKVEVPLSTIGADNQTIDGIWFQNASAAPAPPFYVTEIYLAP